MHFADFIVFDKQKKEPVYLQAAESVIAAIQKGTLPRGYKLPGVKKLSQLTGLYTRTIEQIYEELYAQGWVIIKPNSGTYVAGELPVQVAGRLMPQTAAAKTKASFSYRHIGLDLPAPDMAAGKLYYDIILNDGHPDLQVMPVMELEKNYRKLLQKKQPGRLFYKASPWGSAELRSSLSAFLNQTRGLNTGLPNVLISKGNQFSIYMILSLALKAKDAVAMAAYSYKGVYTICRFLGLPVYPVNMDEDGMDLHALESLSQKRKIKAVYITPHLQYPTGIQMTAERRNQLVALARRYGFLIIEDDYDFDFHYSNRPVLPVASIAPDYTVYVGGLNRLINASLRISYIVGPEDFLAQLAKLKFSIDQFSDTILEEALALTLQEKIIQRYRNKATRHYRQQMDFFCALVEKELGAYCHFKKPTGGMALWIEFNAGIDLDQLSLRCRKQGLLLPSREGLYTFPPGSGGMRIGFGATPVAELARAVSIIRKETEELIRESRKKK